MKNTFKKSTDLVHPHYSKMLFLKYAKKDSLISEDTSLENINNENIESILKDNKKFAEKMDYIQRKTREFIKMPERNYIESLLKENILNEINHNEGILKTAIECGLLDSSATIADLNDDIIMFIEKSR
jgi:hypothetical protein